jgi:hypothetical protein
VANAAALGTFRPLATQPSGVLLPGPFHISNRSYPR